MLRESANASFCVLYDQIDLMTIAFESVPTKFSMPFDFCIFININIFTDKL